MAYTIKQHDTLPILDAALTSGPTSGSQTPVILSGATVILVMKNTTGGLTTRLGATITNASLGTVARVWQVGDTDTTGTYNAEWEVSFTLTKIQTFPNESYFTITIADDLD